MAELFSPQYQWLWTAILALALFLPVRRLIWIMSVRRTARKTGQPVAEADQIALKRRAGVTSALLCFVFAVLYVQVVFSQLHGYPGP